MSTPEGAKGNEARAFAAFVISGGLAAGVNVLSRYVISKWLPFEAAIALAYILGMTTAFLLTKAFVFKKSEVHWLLEYGRFALVNVVAFIQVLLVSEGLVRLLFPRIGFHWHPEEIGHLIGVMSPIVTSYYAHKHFSFRPAAPLKAKP